MDQINPDSHKKTLDGKALNSPGKLPFTKGQKDLTFDEIKGTLEFSVRPVLPVLFM